MNMVAAMDSNLGLPVMDVYNDMLVESETMATPLPEQFQFSTPRDSEPDVGPEKSVKNMESLIVRSVAMSANIAHTVNREVNHLIRVDSFNDYLDQLASENIPNIQSASPPTTIPNSACSHILPSEKENILLGIILSKWDDIMGPQTVHVWLQNNPQEIDEQCPLEVTSKPDEDGKANECIHSKNPHLMKAIKYVTCHTVNYVSVTSASLLDSSHKNIFNEKNSTLFIVPDLNIVAQSLVFQLRTRELNIPYSLSLVVPYEHYEYHLHLRQVSQLWLRWISTRLHHLLLMCIQANKEFVTSEPVNQLMLEFSLMLQSLKTCGLGTLSHPWQCPLQILKHPLLERALTSHLQTFGCTVVMGPSADKINDLIAFLALFLETDELFCSRSLLPPFKYSFHKGLYLQGLILDEFGCRELSSEEISANPYPVTTIDLTRGTAVGAVKQSSFRPAADTSKHQSMLSPVKGTKSSLVQGALRDLKLLPMEEWKCFTEMFLAKIRTLSQTLIDLAAGMCSDGGLGRKNVQIRKHLSRAMNLEDADFLIVLSSAEKLKPGTFFDILYPVMDSR